MAVLLDHSLPKDFTFQFCYFISNSKERNAKTAKMIKFYGVCDNVPTVIAARLDIGAK